MEIPGLETRSYSATLTAEAKKLVGYAAVFNSLSEPLRTRAAGKVIEFREIIRPGAFGATLANAANDVLALRDHDAARLLGRRSSGTLKLTQDDKGLRAEVDTPDTAEGRDTLELVRRRDINGMSFGFTPAAGGQRFTREGDVIVRELTKIDLVEVTFTPMPAYTATSAEVRTLWEGAGPVTTDELAAIESSLAKRRRQLCLHRLAP